MTRERTQYRCRDCASVTPRWAGRCGQCGEWNTLEEEAVPVGSRSGSGGGSGGAGSGGSGRRAVAPAVELHAVPAGADAPRPTGLAELDRVLGGGVVPSSVTLLAGEPGTGKSTLLLQMLAALAAAGSRTLLITAEEAPAQVRRRAARLGLLGPGVLIAAETDLAAIRAIVAEAAPDVVVIDSVQTIHDPDTGSQAGTPAQVRACAQALADDARAGGPAVVLVGHVTKDGSIAGPRVLEHLVDTVLSFEGDRHHALRLLRAVKHRFGAVGELGMWEMTSAGLVEVADAAGFLLADRRPGTPGSVVFAAMEGRRPLLVEIQALVVPTPGGSARRAASGYETGRLWQLLAVLERRAGLSLAGHDVYVSAVGGVRLDDPGADVAVALAVASALTGRLVAEDLVVLGEVGLGGELRQVAHTPRRLSEAARLGFGRALTPPGGAGAIGLDVEDAATLVEALDRHLGSPVPAPRLRVVGQSRH